MAIRSSPHCHETTAHLVGNGTAALLSHGGQLAQLRSDPGIMPGAVSELMRRCGPVQTGRLRYAAEDMEVAGARTPRGGRRPPRVRLGRLRPRRYTDPDRLDLRRHPVGQAENHLGFGHGIHYCLGASLARLEAEIAFGSLFDRCPDLRLALEPAELERRERMPVATERPAS
jgi:cytochrome P450